MTDTNQDINLSFLEKKDANSLSGTPKSPLAYPLRPSGCGYSFLQKR